MRIGFFAVVRRAAVRLFVVFFVLPMRFCVAMPPPGIKTNPHAGQYAGGRSTKQRMFYTECVSQGRLSAGTRTPPGCQPRVVAASHRPWFFSK